MADTTVVSLAAMQYFSALGANGLFLVDGEGKGDINPALGEVVNALHHALAGGKIKISIITPGAPAAVHELEARKEAAIASMNVRSPLGGPIVFSP